MYIIEPWTFVGFHFTERFYDFFGSYFKVVYFKFEGSCWCTSNFIIGINFILENDLPLQWDSRLN